MIPENTDADANNNDDDAAQLLKLSWPLAKIMASGYNTDAH